MQLIKKKGNEKLQDKASGFRLLKYESMLAKDW